MCNLKAKSTKKAVSISSCEGGFVVNGNINDLINFTQNLTNYFLIKVKSGIITLNNRDFEILSAVYGLNGHQQIYYFSPGLTTVVNINQRFTGSLALIYTQYGAVNHFMFTDRITNLQFIATHTSTKLYPCGKDLTGKPQYLMPNNGISLKCTNSLVTNYQTQLINMQQSIGLYLDTNLVNAQTVKISTEQFTTFFPKKNSYASSHIITSYSKQDVQTLLPATYLQDLAKFYRIDKQAINEYLFEHFKPNARVKIFNELSKTLQPLIVNTLKNKDGIKDSHNSNLSDDSPE
jgi:hypothetical protein